MKTTTPEEDTLLLKDIMVAIQEVSGTFESKIDSVANEVVRMRADFQKLCGGVKEAEEVRELKATTATLEAKKAIRTCLADGSDIANECRPDIFLP
ncbi:hypothetical protein NDU88_005919 [Pleurodeles waltl]|uniref:Uncharacterized protein n=1 Tax=Pleurodeles waltl TaxID=8319 RepID=A0AAV7LQX2_PLEWA|nr:hypothetical protein NDU88_005919 [Pleurodeles waltl]